MPKHQNYCGRYYNEILQRVIKNAESCKYPYR